MDKVNHFEIPADDVERASEFYKDLFDWKIDAVPNMPYWMVYTCEVDDKMMCKEPNVINGGMMKRDGENISPVIVITVDDIKAKIKEIKEKGGEVTLDIQEVGDMGLYARFKDSEGNILGLWESLKK